MARMQVYLPDDLYERVKARGLPASELLQKAVRAELRRLELLAETDRYVADLVAEVGPPTAAQRGDLRADRLVRWADRRAGPPRSRLSAQAKEIRFRPLWPRLGCARVVFAPSSAQELAMQIILNIPEQYLVDENPAELGRRIKLYASLRMFQSGELSAGAAAELCGVDRFTFTAACQKHGIPAANYPAEELQAEINALRRVG